MTAFARPLVRVVAAAALLTGVVGGLQPLAARPQYLGIFQVDPYRRAEVDGCVTCHVNPAGGGARNEFGGAFEAATRDLTPLLRASFPQNFKFDTVTLADGSAFLFSDPYSKFVVYERDRQRVLVELAALNAPKAAPLPVAATRMGFFVTSTGLGRGGQLGGLAGADRHCQSLAAAAGAGDRTWRAYLSTSFKGQPAAHAGDRIGGGPWYNAKGILIARGPADLLITSQLSPEIVLTEKGQPIITAAAGPPVSVLTGTLPNGTAAVDQNCQNWMSATEGDAMAGDPAGVWNSARTTSCGPPPGQPEAGPSRLYCFAAR